ncbi:hypothetical protein KAS41_04880, partial [Candidatus Parcubacteria bacterium]|nr:hypothetical protein [Candidatus Parcubacteria bacterium]
KSAQKLAKKTFSKIAGETDVKVITEASETLKKISKSKPAPKIKILPPKEKLIIPERKPVSSELKNLAEEAKKYKSAQEFADDFNNSIKFTKEIKKDGFKNLDEYYKTKPGLIKASELKGDYTGIKHFESTKPIKTTEGKILKMHDPEAQNKKLIDFYNQAIGRKSVLPKKAEQKPVLPMKSKIDEKIIPERKSFLAKVDKISDDTRKLIENAEQRKQNLIDASKNELKAPEVKVAIRKVQEEIDLLKADKTYSSVQDILKKKIKPDTYYRDQKLAAKEETINAAKGLLGETENQYTQFKELVSRVYGTQKKYLKEGAQDIAQLKNLARKKGYTGESVNNILYSQEKTGDEMLDKFKQQLSKEKDERGLKTFLKKKRTEINRELRAEEKTGKIDRLKKEEFVKGEYSGFKQGLKEAEENLKHKVKERVNKVKYIRDYFKLSDSEMRSINRRDVRFMDDREFNDFIELSKEKAWELADTKQKKQELLSWINEQEFKRHENLQQAMKLPTLDKMNIKQLGQFVETLKKYEPGDLFLGQRKLETIDRTDLKGIRTLREAREKMAKEMGVDIADLDNIKYREFDEFRYDTALADINPFYKILVDDTNRGFLKSEAKYLELEEKINKLTKVARKSKKRGFLEKAIPQDKKVFAWLEAKNNDKALLAGNMTKEELDLAYFIRDEYSKIRDYLVSAEMLKTGRENYITHIRKKFLEAWKDDGLVGAFKNMFEAHKMEEDVFKILDERTGEILPLEKFFQFAMRRTGEIKPTKNVAKAFLSYVKIFEKKRALDSLMPKFDTYSFALTPEEATRTGLLKDLTLDKFVKRWVNNKKGRKADIWFLKQGSKIDTTLRGIKMFTTIFDLGFNLKTSIASFAGETATNFVMLGHKKFALGEARKHTKQGRVILEKYKNFTGKGLVEELGEASDDISDKFLKVIFG